MPPSTVRLNEPHWRTSGLRTSAARKRSSTFLASVKFIDRERGFFWALWTYASFAKGACLDAGFSADVPNALQTIAAVPGVGRSKVALMDPRMAYATFAFVWLGSPVIDPGTHAPEDDAYEIARSHQWNPPEPPHRVERSN